MLFMTLIGRACRYLAVDHWETKSRNWHQRRLNACFPVSFNLSSMLTMVAVQCSIAAHSRLKGAVPSATTLAASISLRRGASLLLHPEFTLTSSRSTCSRTSASLLVIASYTSGVRPLSSFESNLDNVPLNQ